jgi:uncharacterized BrkB/YihY/UPF0761 family membrane protein
MRLKAIWQLVRDTFSEWSQDNAPRMGAALSYYTAFSLAPLLIIAIGIAGLVFGAEAARGEIHVRWRDVWIGAAGSLVVVLVWVYYSAQIMLFGAEFTHLYAQRAGSRQRQEQEQRQPVLPAARRKTA